VRTSFFRVFCKKIYEQRKNKYRLERREKTHGVVLTTTGFRPIVQETGQRSGVFLYCYYLTDRSLSLSPDRLSGKILNRLWRLSSTLSTRGVFRRFATGNRSTVTACGDGGGRLKRQRNETIFLVSSHDYTTRLRLRSWRPNEDSFHRKTNVCKALPFARPARPRMSARHASAASEVGPPFVLDIRDSSQYRAHTPRIIT